MPANRIASLVWIDRNALPSSVRRSICRDLTSRSKYAEEDAKALVTWSRKVDQIGLPLSYGLQIAASHGIELEDKRSRGSVVRFSKIPTPRNRTQEAFFNTLLTSLKRNPATLAVAPTGTGKTVAGLQCIAKLNRTALVIVPSKNLAQQWKAEAMLHLGLPEKRIHIFEEGKCAWEGYSIVIAVIHNLCNRRWPREFYRHFGIVIWDEAHRVGAEVFSQSIKKFPARYRLALTATPKRKDGRTSILTNAFGVEDKKVEGNNMIALPCTAYVVNTTCKIKAKSYGSRVMQMGALISAVAGNEDRNWLILDIVLRGWDHERNILVLSDRIEQLRWLQTALELHDVPSRDIGLFIGSASKERLHEIKKSCRIILATYGMMKEGQDVPRLDMGIDATPRSEGVQAIGRIRRQLPDKPMPIWVTLFDSNGSQLLKGIAGARIKDYKACGVKVINIDGAINRIPFGG